MDSFKFARQCRIIKGYLGDNSLAYALYHLGVLARLEPDLFAKDYDKLIDIRTNYNRMLEYASLGMSDDKAQVYFSKYLEEVYMIVQNVILQQMINQDPVFKASYKCALQIGSCDIQTQLTQLSETESEAYDKITREMATFDSEKVAFEEAADFRSRLFSYILVSPQWTSSEKTDMVNLVTSSLTDGVSAQVMVSAIMLACLAVFDYRKFLALLDIYKKTEHVRVKERALVAIGLLCSVNDNFYKKKITEILNNECKQNPSFFKELVDLQKQITICLNTKEIDKLLKSNFMRNEQEINKVFNSLKRSQDEDRPNNPLTLGTQHKEFFQKLYEGLEQTLSLEKSGYDTEYEMFAKLKDIPFFRSLVNWFTPFYNCNPNLPVLSGAAKNAHAMFDFLRGMTTATDCGNYAWAYTFFQSYNTRFSSAIEKNIYESLNMSKSKRKVPHTPSDYRLLYLRDVYRFFTLSSLNTFVPHVFEMKEDEDVPVLFMLQHKLDSEIYDKGIRKICRFLYKRHDWKMLDRFMRYVEEPDEEYCMYVAIVAQKLNKDVAIAIPYAEKLYMSHLDNLNVTNTLAQLYTLNKDFQKLVDLFNHSNLWNPKNPKSSIALPKALCSLGRNAEAIQKLFELYYDNPQNEEVLDMLWRTLLDSENTEKAYQIIQKMKALDHVAAKDMLYEHKIVESLYLLEKGKNKEAFIVGLQCFDKLLKELFDLIIVKFQVMFDEFAHKFTNLSPFAVLMLREHICQYVYAHLDDFTENGNFI